MKKNIQIGAIALTFLLGACQSNEIGHSKDVAQNTIYKGFFVNYDENTNATSVTAYFRFSGENGTTLILDEPSSVTCNGAAMSLQQGSWSGAYYETTNTPPSVSQDFSIVFKDSEGKTTSANTHIRPLTIQYSGITFPPQSDWKMPLSRPLEADEEIEIEIEAEPRNEKDEQGTRSLSLSNAYDNSIQALDISQEKILEEIPKNIKYKYIKMSAEIRKRKTIKDASQKGGELQLTHKLKEIKLF